MKRIFLIVLDSLGAGAQPDSAHFGDAGAHTLRACHAAGNLHIPNLKKAGLGCIDGLSFLGTESAPAGAFARLEERSAGKDTTIGHWEIAGIVSESPLPTYPEGFPEAVLAPFRAATGRGVLCNLPYSGTACINEYGDTHVKTGDLIVYTSADSVFQIAAHEEVVPPEELYDICRKARTILQGEHGVGRVIARPFIGSGNGNYTRTANRHDFSLLPPQPTLLDAVKDAGKAVIAVGKITDIFAGQGVTETVLTKGNTDGLAKTLALASRDFTGLCFVNLVDFDMLYGHRRDAEGYAAALNEFDAWLPQFLAKLGEDDLVLITADHGCDPAFTKTTDHTREYVPLLILGAQVKPANLGTRSGFCDIAATAARLLGVPLATPGTSFAKEILR
ncbi:MAG: phosphopentomutase [Oscillospiraceae bacterium]|nr:phosphopentomutase [Oscillospiraceae bacterium]